MAQDKPTKQRRRDPLVAMAPTNGFGAVKSSASETSPFPSFWLPNAQGLGAQHPLSSYASFSEHSFPFLEQFPSTSPSAVLAAGTFDIVTHHNRANSKTSFGSLGPIGWTSSSHELPPVFPAGTPTQSNQKRSRLPSNEVGRKAPRKSEPSRPALDSVVRRPRGRPPKQRSQLSLDRPLQVNTKPLSKNVTGGPRPLTPSSFQRSLVSAPQSMAPTPFRNRRIVLDDEGDEEEYIEYNQGNSLRASRGRLIVPEDEKDYVENPPKKSLKESRKKRNPSSANDTSVSKDGNDFKTKTAQRRSLRNQPSSSLTSPKFNNFYPVPKEMEEIQQALGEKNWEECLALVERYCLDELTEEQLVAASKPVFGAINEPTRNKVLRQMIKKVVAPVLESQ